eukprot:6427-Heterococcus_DN1.PRE.16
MQLDFFFGCVARLQLLAMVRQRRTISTVALSLACAWLTPRASTLHVSCSAHSALSAPAAAAVVRSSFSRHVLHAAAAAELPMRSKGGRRAVKTDDGTVVTFVNPSPEVFISKHSTEVALWLGMARCCSAITVYSVLKHIAALP